MKQNLFFIFLCFTLLGFAQNNATSDKLDPRPSPNKITLLWDTSLPLKNRNTEQEFQLLRSYLAELNSVQITVSKFGTTVYDSKVFNCSDGCSELYEYLTNSEYNGASNYSELLQTNKSKANIVLVFTNGISLFEPLDSQLNIPVFVVNSKRDAEHNYLNEFASVTKGGYIDLSQKPIEDGLQKLNYFVKEEPVNSQVQGTDNLYYGVVYNEDKTPIQGAVVRIKNSFAEVQTESNGRYKIAAKAGDILEVTALGMYTKDTVLSDTKKTHIPLKADGELLDEVLVQQKKKSDEVRKTAFGDKSKEELGYHTDEITKDQISLADINAYEVLLRQQGIELYQGALYFRKAISINRTPILIYLDGVPVDSNVLQSLDARLIENITQLKTLASTVRFGSAGVGGVVLIETSNAKEAEAAVKENRALVKGNEYTETLPTLEVVSATIPKSNYLLALEKSTSFEQAKKLYYKQLKYERNNIAYYLEVAPYFERWNSSFSNDILSNIAAVAPRNAKALKVLAYAYEEKGEFEKAKYIYEQLVNLRPQDAQSYRDLALIYAQTKEYELAATLYRQMVYNTIPKVDFAPIQEIVFNEFRHLIKNHKSQINYKGLPNELLSLEFKKDIRVVLEWNLPATEFDVQTVSPEEKFFNFSHTAFSNKELLQSEIDEGFHMKEFIIDDGEKGKWLLNIRYNGQNNGNIPLILKYTLYKNYGKPNETREIKTIQLDLFQDKLTLDSFVN
ncbi:MAG: carboxypeptidase-like regulatory domain-containing protein [Bacteroidota bacterium]